jgi:TPR repeat protein
MTLKRKRNNDEIMFKNLVDFISIDNFKDVNFDNKINELSKFDINEVIEYINSCNKTNKKFFKEIFYLIGGIYHFGFKVEKNLETSFKYIKIAADYGLYHVCFNVGHNYEYGIGCEKNIEESHKYYKLAANNNDIRSQYHLGVIYESGIGCEKNITESFKYFKMCADNTIDIEPKIISNKYITLSKYNVGVYYFKGIGIEKNYNEGVRYIKMAADVKLPEAIFTMYSFYHAGEGVEKNMDEAMKYINIGVEMKDPLSIYQAIILYYNYGIYDIPQNIEEGFRHIKLFVEGLTIDNIYCKVTKKFTNIGNYLYKIIYEILLQNDMELYFVQEVISKYSVYSNLNSLLQFKLNKKKLPNYTKIDKCMICFEDNISTQLFDCLGHYYCQNCTIKIKDCCLCKSKKRCFH